MCLNNSQKYNVTPFRKAIDELKSNTVINSGFNVLWRIKNMYMYNFDHIFTCKWELGGNANANDVFYFKF